MATFTILTGKALTSAIKGFGATVATFSAKTHQLAYSALSHVEEHHCASHLNALFAVTPMNYRSALRIWATDLGKITFNAEPEEAGQFFAYAKGSKSDLPVALAVGPVEYVRATKDAAAKPFDEIAAFEALAKRLADKGGSARAIELANAAVRALKTPIVAATASKAAPKAKATPTLAVDNGPTVTPAAPMLDLVAVAA